MHNLIAFYESITNNSTYTEVNGVLDQSMSLDSNSRFIMPGNWKILGAYGMGINLSAFRLSAPSLRTMFLPEIYPANDTADVPVLDAIVNYAQYGPRLVQNEPLIVECSRAGADAQPVIGGIWIAPDFTPAPRGPAYTARFTFTLTIVAGSWVLGALTQDQTLPAGDYEVVGMACVCNDATFARLVFPGVSQLRPGVLVNDAYGDLTLTDPFRFGRFGTFGRFSNTAIPAIEVLGDTAGAETGAVYLDLIKVR
jgi:hypothetical protein